MKTLIIKPEHKVDSCFILNQHIKAIPLYGIELIQQWRWFDVSSNQSSLWIFQEE